MWSNEKKFYLDGPDGFNYYWHDIRKEKIYSIRRSMGGGGVMIWESLWYDGKSELSFIETRLNAEEYRNLLENHLDKISRTFRK